MATGMEMFRALKRATQSLPAGSTFKVNIHDKLDLCKLTVEDLVSAGFTESVAERISADLMRQSLKELSDALDVRLVAERGILTLIPGEGLRRAGETLKNDPQTLDETLEEIRKIRNWSRAAK